MRKDKLKAVSQEERLHKGKEHFKNLLRNPPKITDKSVEKTSVAKWTSNYTVYLRRIKYTIEKQMQKSCMP